MRIKLLFLLLTLVTAAIHAQDASEKVLTGHSGAVNSIALSPDGRRLISGSKDETIRIWDLEKNEVVKTIGPCGASIKRICFNPDGTRFIAALYGHITEYELKSFKKRKSRNIHTSFVETCLYSPDGSMIMTSSWRDNSLVILKSKTLKKQVATSETVWVDNAIFNSQGTIVYSGGHDNLVKMWDVSTGGMIKSFAGHDDWVYDLCLSADGKYLFSGGFDNVIKVWDLNSGKNVHTLKGHTEGIVCLDMSANGKYLASAGVDKMIIIWDTETKKELLKLQGHEGVIMDIKFSGDGKSLYSCSVDKTIRKWNLNLN